MRASSMLPGLAFLSLGALAGAQTTSNTLSPEMLEYQFNEVRGTSVSNTASMALLPATGTVNLAGWFGDPGRYGFKGNEPGFGCLRYGALAWVHTGWQISVQGSFTIMFWMRRDPASTSTNPFGYAFGDVSFRAFAAGAAGQGITFRGSSIGNVDSGFAVTGTPGVWQHVALVVDDLAGQAYWHDNGVPSTNIVSFTPGTFAYSGTRFMAVAAQGDSGLSPFGNHYDMDDFRFYSRALTPPEVQSALLHETATTSPYGNGCAGTAGIPLIGANGAPFSGNSSFALTLGNAEPSRSGLLVIGIEADTWSSVIPLPFSMEFLYGPGSGCELQTGLDVLVPVFTGAGSLIFPAPIPMGFAGAHGYAQFVLLGTQGAVTSGLDINIEQP